MPCLNPWGAFQRVGTPYGTLTTRCEAKARSYRCVVLRADQFYWNSQQLLLTQSRCTDRAF